MYWDWVEGMQILIYQKKKTCSLLLRSIRSWNKISIWKRKKYRIKWIWKKTAEKHWFIKNPFQKVRNKRENQT